MDQVLDFFRWLVDFGPEARYVVFALPVAVALLIGLSTLFVQAGAVLVGAERLTFWRWYAVAAAELAVLLPLGFGLATVVYNATGEVLTTFLIATAAGLLIDLVLFTGLVRLLGDGTTIPEALLAWAWRLPLPVVVACLAAGYSIAAGAIVFWLLSGLILWMAIALAGVENFTFLRALFLSTIDLALRAGATYVILLYLDRSDPREWLVGDRLLLAGHFMAFELPLLLVLLLVGGKIKVGRGFLVWLGRLFIQLVISGLIAGAVFVALGAYQALQEPNGRFNLVQIGSILMYVVGVCVLLFVGSGLIRTPLPKARRAV